MRNYILKRLLIAIPTLLGITVITFLLIRLAPGDPGAMEAEAGSATFGEGVSRETVERTRKLFGLDKPILLNFDVKDRRRAVLSAWEAVVETHDEIRTFSEEWDPVADSDPAAARDPVAVGQVEHGKFRETLQWELEKRQRRLAAFGKRLIPYLLPLALGEKDEERLGLLKQALQEGAGIDAAQVQGGFSAWWEAHGADFTPEAMGAQLEAYVSSSQEEAPARAERIRNNLGALILPLAMERIEACRDQVFIKEGSSLRFREFREGDDSPGRDEVRYFRRLVTLAAPWAGYTRPLGPDAEARRFAVALDFLDAWWQREGLAYREISGKERFFKTFTEAQFPLWLGRIFTLDFGESYIDRQPVSGKVWEAFKVTLSFQLLVIFLIYLISIPVGVLSAVKQDSLWDRTLTLALFVLYSLPNFWVAYMLIYFLTGAQWADLFPVQGLNTEGAENWAFWPFLTDRLWHMCLPVACMTYGGLAVLSRYTRAGMLEVIRQDYIRTARAKGLSEKCVIFKHALRNGIIPIVTLIGELLPALISGSVIIEYIFGIPGMGRLGYTAVLERDYPVVMAIALFTAVLVLLGVLLSDLLYGLVDPRIRLEEKN